MGAFAFATGGGSGGGGGGTPGGVNGDIQFNSAGAFGGAPTFQFDSVNQAVRGLTGLTRGFELFNTVDLTTNTERLRSFWSGSVAHIITDTQGTGTQRELRLGTFNGGVAQNMVRVFGSAGTPFVRFTNANSSNTSFVGWDFVNGSLTAASGVQTLLSVSTTINQSGTAGYNAILISNTETSTGSGQKNFVNLQISGTSRYRIDNLGNLYQSSLATGGRSDYNTADEVTNFERNQQFWSSNVYNIQNNEGGTGTTRELRVGNTANYLRIFAQSAGTQFEFQGASSSVVASNGVVRAGITSTASSGSHIYGQLSCVVNQSGTAGYTGFDINVTHTTTGSGGKQAFQTRLGGVVQFQIGDTGRLRHIAANSSTTVGATGAAAALPANPLGYLIMEVAGSPVKVPYYNN